MNTRGLQILFPDGNPNGIKRINIPGWEGSCLVVPRQHLKLIKNTNEATLRALYFLFGNNELNQLQVYIGESESFYNRISNHNQNKDFWDTAIIFTQGLNRALVKYLEFMATVRCSDIDRVEMLNKVQPQENTLSNFEKMSVNQYFENIDFILSALRYPVFDEIELNKTQSDLYYLNTEHTEALAIIQADASLLVLQGAKARIREAGAFGGWAKQARENYLAEKMMVAHDEDSYITTTDILFKSPSAAATFLSGRSINGWISWKDGGGKTMDENLR